MSNQVLAKWLGSVLKTQCHDGTVLLEDGREANVEFDGECVQAYTYDDNDEPVYHARIRLVQETD